MTRVGFFSGSFDPMTNGHLDVIEHAAALCDRLVVGVGSNPNKAALFTVEERLKLIHEAAAPIMAKAQCELDVVEFTGLAIEAARKAGATLIFRGLRDGTDFDYEMQMAGMNGAMAPELRTVFLPAVLAGEADHRDAGAADRLDGRRRLRLRAAERDQGAEGEVREGFLRSNGQSPHPSALRAAEGPDEGTTPPPAPDAALPSIRAAS